MKKTLAAVTLAAAALSLTACANEADAAEKQICVNHKRLIKTIPESFQDMDDKAFEYATLATTAREHDLNELAQMLEGYSDAHARFADGARNSAELEDYAVAITLYCNDK